MSNVETHRAAHEAFNRRDFQAAVKDIRDDVTYTDHPRGLTMKGPLEYADWLQGWATAFSDGRIEDARYIDGGDHTVAIFQGRGTNDGVMGPLTATGRRIDVPNCEIFKFDKAGHIVEGEAFYDSMTMLVQLGLAKPPM